ncbi:MAG: polysaccharide biosynthesis tyrosine autokinase [Gammaproteobacteria bacterium]|nr:MAG: polysaccharide biosynthesis tyrosine autokinase [Gammaproteobacteria bacterium]
MHDIAERHGGAMGQESAGDDVGVGEIFAALRRRIWVLLGIVVPVLAVTAGLLSLLTPRYTAELLIMIEAADNQRFVSLDSVVAGLSGDEQSVQSEAHVLRSRALAERVVQRLGLAQDPEFSEGLDPALSPAVRLSAILERYLDRLEVAPLDNSRVIAVRFSSRDPEKAARIANALADEYLQSRLETKFELTHQANTWLSQRIAELRRKTADAEAAVEKARAELGLLEGNGITLTSQELAELNTQLVLARTERAEAEARLAQVQQRAGDRGGAETTLEVLQSPLIQRLREQEAEVQRRVAELSSELGPKHPRMIQLQAEAADLRERIDREVRKIITGLRNEVNVARARERAIARSLDELKSRKQADNQGAIRLRQLEREAAANRELLDTLLARQKETASQEDLNFQQPDATVFSPAVTPAEPSWPRTGLVLGLAGLGALMLGLLTVLLLELMDAGFRSGEQFEQYTGVPSLGFIPLVRKPREFRTLPGYLAERPASALGESLRTLSWSLRLAFPDQPPRRLLFASALPNEGKTTVASCLATAEANAGRRVVLVDADIRQPGCHELAGIAREPGLSNLLAGDATVDEVLAEAEWQGLKVIPAGQPSSQAPNLLGSERMRKLLAELDARFDLVVIDSPPVMAAADARILAGLADATVLVIRWGKTRRSTARLALRQLQGAGARIAGGLLSMVDVKRNAQYGYGDSGAYSGELGKYYVG